ncbi:uncharacterized protein PV09_08777 [Verruconis gallopava]|uniref:Calcium channel YVC1-like C-terminal transmembrane domain-containing protein n=1 Tax=Verruconis gallopava TaxID=253628 RepID=A0A0D1ZYV1_9PEZI|nr:uncharacterized protein PV09_08777 [Verruconis gallopava]KIV99602.1 hypothetical protein PV09_08777 [Verruconis gallopava]
MARDRPLSSTTPRYWPDEPLHVPCIRDDEAFPHLLSKLSIYITDAIVSPHSFEELRSPVVEQRLSPLIDYIADSVHNRAIVCALLALKGYFTALESDENRGVNLSRGFACEYVAWRFLTHLSGRELIHFLLYELPPHEVGTRNQDEEAGLVRQTSLPPSAQPLDGSQPTLLDSSILGHGEDVAESSADDHVRSSLFEIGDGGDFVASFDHLNALEIAAVTNAKKFLSQRVVQRIIESIWKGDIVFWETLDVGSEKEAKIYNKRKADPYCRLRVPRYLKTFEALFLISFVIVYLAVLIPVQRNSHSRPRRPGVPPLTTNYSEIDLGSPIQNFRHITPAEILLYIWLVAFAYDEFGEYMDAGTAFYTTDFWSLWDIGIVAIGVAFFITRMIGLSKNSDEIIGTAFDILALEALFLIPRLCSILSLNPYFGTIIPCLREMTKDFFKFLSIVAILYLGFLTTFTLLARDNFSLREMSWILVKVFFGSSYLGFDVAQDISPALGPPLMLVFVTLTNILLITSLISLLSNSLTRILEHARDEYLYIYSIYVLEASTSNRLTYFLPPLNLIPLLLRPLRLLIAPEKLRKARIFLLKATHAPFVLAIWSYEGLADYFAGTRKSQPPEFPSLGGPTDATARSLKRSSYLRPFTSRAPMVADNGHNSFMRHMRDNRGRKSSRPTTATAGIDPQGDLRDLVLKLSSQIEDLTVMVADQQKVKQYEG